MKRVLVDYKKLDHQVANLLIENYPYGYGDDDIIMFKNRFGEIVEAVEIRTEDTVYLVKISKSLTNFIANFDESIDKELSNPPKIALTHEDFDDEETHPELELNLDIENQEDFD